MKSNTLVLSVVLNKSQFKSLQFLKVTLAFAMLIALAVAFIGMLCGLLGWQSYSYSSGFIALSALTLILAGAHPILRSFGKKGTYRQIDLGKRRKYILSVSNMFVVSPIDTKPPAGRVTSRAT